MKKLLVIRHAKSSWDHPDLADDLRPLNQRGLRDAPRMAKRLKEKRIFPDTMITSPAVRAFDTCHAFADVLSFTRAKIDVRKQLYHASAEEILEVVNSLRDFDDTEEVTLLFGHNPGLTEFVNLLTSENIMNVPTCGMACISLSVATWRKVKFGIGTLEFFDFPKSKP